MRTFINSVLQFILSAIIGAAIAYYLVTFIFNFMYENSGYIGHLVQEGSRHWWSIPALPIIVFFIACLAFSLRQRAPHVYGGVEVGIGIVSGSMAFMEFVYTSLEYNNQSPTDTVLSEAAYSFAFAGSIYIIVRGLDNIGKDVMSPRFPDGRFKRLWARCFP